MMTKLLEEIEKLVQKELHMANCDHPPVFNSDHEAYAVVKEEVEESEHEFMITQNCLQMCWFSIRHNEEPDSHISFGVEKAMHLAAEAIQVAAMLVKWQNTLAVRRVEHKVDAMEAKADEAETKLARSAWDDKNPFDEGK